MFLKIKRLKFKKMPLLMLNCFYIYMLVLMLSQVLIVIEFTRIFASKTNGALANVAVNTNTNLTKALMFPCKVCFSVLKVSHRE